MRASLALSQFTMQGSYTSEWEISCGKKPIFARAETQKYHSGHEATAKMGSFMPPIIALFYGIKEIKMPRGFALGTFLWQQNRKPGKHQNSNSLGDVALLWARERERGACYLQSWKWTHSEDPPRPVFPVSTLDFSAQSFTRHIFIYARHTAISKNAINSRIREGSIHSNRFSHHSNFFKGCISPFTRSHRKNLAQGCVAAQRIKMELAQKRGR